MSNLPANELLGCPMVPCPWALHAMRLLRDHPNTAFGVHLTVISRFADYQWGPLIPRDEVPSLLDEPGSCYSNDRRAELLAHARLDELEIEFRAQIEAVLVAGSAGRHPRLPNLTAGLTASAPPGSRSDRSLSTGSGCR